MRIFFLILFFNVQFAGASYQEPKMQNPVLLTKDQMQQAFKLLDERVKDRAQMVDGIHTQILDVLQFNGSEAQLKRIIACSASWIHKQEIKIIESKLKKSVEKNAIAQNRFGLLNVAFTQLYLAHNNRPY